MPHFAWRLMLSITAWELYCSRSPTASSIPYATLADSFEHPSSTTPRSKTRLWRWLRQFVPSPSALDHRVRVCQHLGPAAEKARSLNRVFICLTRRSHLSVDRSRSPEADECVSLLPAALHIPLLVDCKGPL